jgi:sirohydrochlorin cobaltochelatase
VRDLYSNVLAASVEGVPDHQAVLERIKRDALIKEYKKVQIIPVMLIAGMHAEDDLMGENESWRSTLEEMGFQVECPTINYDGSTYFKGLAFYPQILDAFMERLQRTLQLAEHY